MHVITATNVHQALPMAVRYLQLHGIRRASRNGPVLVAPGPVTTEYRRPQERLVFWPQRDANTAFLLAESLWMLAGRRDLAPLVRYIKDFGRYSDDGVTLHGAYGHRWRIAFGDDQLAKIARRLADDADDRRCVLQIWDAEFDLDIISKDLPCNDTVAFQRDANGALDMTVFCRSNDMVWGAYFANAAHFSMLQEYLACWIGCPVGRYWQVSVNFHAYLETLAQVADLPKQIEGVWGQPFDFADPYSTKAVRPIGLANGGTGDAAIERIDRLIAEMMRHADTGFIDQRESNDDDPWYNGVWAVLLAHERWRTLRGHERYIQAQAALNFADPSHDWVASMRAWVLRREAAFLAKQEAHV